MEITIAHLPSPDMFEQEQTSQEERKARFVKKCDLLRRECSQVSELALTISVTMTPLVVVALSDCIECFCHWPALIRGAETATCSSETSMKLL